MADELVDIIDQNNRVVGQVAKREAHEKGLLHRTIIAEVIDSIGRWLLVQQAQHKQDAGQYVSPVGGHIRSGETEVEALKREALEELGIKDFQYKRIGQAIFDRSVRDQRENHLFIVYEIYSDHEPRLNDESVLFDKRTREEWKKLMKENPKEFGDAWYFVVKHFYPEFITTIV